MRVVGTRCAMSLLVLYAVEDLETPVPELSSRVISYYPNPRLVNRVSTEVYQG